MGGSRDELDGSALWCAFDKRDEDDRSGYLCGVSLTLSNRALTSSLGEVQAGL